MRDNWWTWKRRQAWWDKLRLFRREWEMLAGMLGWILVSIGLACVCAGLVEGRAGLAIAGALAIALGYASMAWAI